MLIPLPLQGAYQIEEAGIGQALPSGLGRVEVGYDVMMHGSAVPEGRMVPAPSPIM